MAPERHDPPPGSLGFVQHPDSSLISYAAARRRSSLGVFVMDQLEDVFNRSSTAGATVPLCIPEKRLPQNGFRCGRASLTTVA